ncbi:sulfotransferase domain-containing protein [Oxynema sp. CENA135]|uniref:sulfotransferase domain-containing protein n=1 Tax=Oxynema sp. CENA135 TaxID=984206 RepID=UPI00190D62C4|nr:sulfotransferase domain-containing protein [Oxynema sp. CENA135]MBK4728692.1 sulfotransferase domain-containing protein [Oxynema sp. CENA135]
MIVWLASYPRSGNTFFRILLNQLYGIKTYSIYNDPLFDKLPGSSDVIGHQILEEDLEELSEKSELTFIKTHDLPSDNNPAIYLVRDGRDSLVSYAHYLISFHQNSRRLSIQKKIKSIFGWNEYNEILKKLIIENDKKHGNWSENVKQWQNHDKKTHTIKFEDLIKNPLDQLEKAVNSLSPEQKFSLNGNDIPSFEELHARWPKFFRQGQSGKWQQSMNDELQELFKVHHGSVMKELGYKV